MTPGHYSHRPVLAADDIALIQRLNRDYLDLLAATWKEGEGPLAPGLMRDLATADGARRDAIAACTYSLFALELPEAILDPASVPRVHDLATERYRFPEETGLWAAFVTTVWFFAWHLSRSSPLSARFMLGFTPGQAAALAGLQPWQMRQLATLQSAPLAPRWRANPCFWPDLVRFAGGGQSLRLTAAHLLGVQLLAAEAEPRIGRAAGRDRLRRP